MSYYRMSKSERREGTYEWLKDQPFTSLSKDIIYWLKSKPQNAVHFLEWFAETYPTKSPEATWEAQLPQIIEWLESHDYHVEDFEDWYVDQVIG